MPVLPSRLVDTRSGTGVRKGVVPSRGSLSFEVLGAGPLPSSGVSAVVVNLTVTGTSAPGYITAFPAGSAVPAVSNLNYMTGQTHASAAIVPVSASGSISFYASAATDLIVDVTGYYAGTPGSAASSSTPPSPTGAFAPVTPSRLVDTRSGTGARSGVIPARGTLPFTVLGAGPVPSSGVSAVVVNLTVTDTAAAGFVAGFATGGSLPWVSNVNYGKGQTTSNVAVLPVSASGSVSFYASAQTDLIVDVAGYIVGPSGSTVASTAAGTYTPVMPTRLVDTRSGTGVRRGVIPARGTARFHVEGAGPVPGSGVSAVVLNVTVADSTALGFVTAFPSGGNLPGVSSVNYAAQEVVPNLVFLPVSSTGDVSFYASSATDLIADVAGYVIASSPTVTAMTANSGPAAGSTRVSIVGADFLHATGVAFGGVAGTALVVNSDGALAVTAPPHTAGQVDVRVTTSDGPTTADAADKFTFIAGQYTIEVGISQATVANAGGWANALSGAQTMIAAINDTFNDPVNHLDLQYSFIATSITEYTDPTSTQLYVPHPNANFKLLIADDSDRGGGWYGTLETVVDYWHFGAEHAFSQNSIDGTVHEFGHSRGAIDEYQLDVPSSGNPIDGTQFDAPEPSIMTYPYGVPTFDAYTQGIINQEGDTLEDRRPESVAAQSLPTAINVLVQHAGSPAPGATIALHAVAWDSGTVTTMPSFTATTGADGEVTLPPNVFGRVADGSKPWDITTPMFLVSVDFGGAHSSTWLDVIDASVNRFDQQNSPYLLSVTD